MPLIAKEMAPNDGVHSGSNPPGHRNSSMMADLPAGRIEASITHAIRRPDDLFGFAQRRNPRRAFLFVSRVLGRHIPVAPSLMRETHEALARQISSDLPGPILVVGMAETAIGLGGGVHDAYVAASGRDDAVFIATTRCQLDSHVLARFSEDHSHATSHLVHQPTLPRIADLVARARALVVVDDEITTGRTISNLRAALIGAGLTRIERTILVTLTDWSDGDAARATPGLATSISLLSGRYRWTPDPAAPPPEMPHVDVTGRSPHTPDPALDWGRLGVLRHSFAINAPTQPCKRILVLGTGEYVLPPFFLADALERAGASVKFSAVTRSPIAVGHAIKSAIAFQDNYGLGIANFLYNVDPDDYDRIILCAETPRASIDPRLIQFLGAGLDIRADGRLQ